MGKKKKDQITEKKKGPAKQVSPSLNLNGQAASWAEGLLIAFFGAFIIMFVRMHTYERPMDQFYWSSGGNQVADFFSYYKMVFVLAAAGITLMILFLRLVSRTMEVKRSCAYIPMAVYSFFVLASYIFSDYKEFSLLGYNDRFEGTLPLLAYMILLFFIINRINTEQDLKWVIVPLGISSFLLSLLGLSQGLDHDFFQTTFGKKLITPSSFWPNVDSLSFTFQNKEIYQTVYNINYVSFYLTLLIPLFGMLFIRESRMNRKILLGVLFALNMYNLIGSQSSGGFLGMAVVVVVALLAFNKRILSWWKPLLVLIAITLAVGGFTYDRWFSELSSAFHSATSTEAEQSAEEDIPLPGTIRPYIDYFKTEGNTLTGSFNGEVFTIAVTPAPEGGFAPFEMKDAEGQNISLVPSESFGIFNIDDIRFNKYATVSYASDGTLYYLILNTPEKQWAFTLEGNKLLHINDLGKKLSLHPVPAYGFENHQGFGSGRGYIWSRTLPMLKETIFLGHGADTYCLYYPHDDYSGKYNATWNVNMIVDKPHNLYLGAAIGTGILSVLALLSLFGIYLVQSFLLYFSADFRKDYLTFVGAGIFLGICGFVASAMVDDSSISVMPMFYTLLGTGIAINHMLKNKKKPAA